MPNVVASTRSLRFLDASGTEYIAVGLSVSESINQPFIAKAFILSDEIIGEDQVGKTGCFLFSIDEEEQRQVYTICHGYVRALHAQPSKPNIDMHCWEVTLVPWLDLLKETINSRIFQEVPIADIIESVISDYTFEHELTFLSQPDTIRPLCIQYQESDYDFVTRLLFEEGYHFYFACDENGHEMVVGNANQSFRQSTQNKISVRRSEVMPEGPSLESWLTRNTIVGGSWEYTGFDPARGAAMVSRCVTPSDGMGIGPSMRWESRQLCQDTLNQSVSRCLEYRGSDRYSATCTSRLPYLHAGLRFTLQGHPDQAQNGVHIISAMEHRLKSPPDSLLINDIHYENSFCCFPVSTVYRSDPLQRKVMDGVQKATVTGPEGEEIHSDDTGRVQVLFHWDKNGEFPCWLPVRQALAGDGYGSSVLPRVGHQVVIDFFDGDPDQPFVTGSLYTAVNKPAEVAVDTLILKTRSTPQGQEDDCHIFRVCDTKDSEELFIQAQKDMLCQVKNNTHMTVTGESLTEVEKTLTVKSKEDMTHETEAAALMKTGSDYTCDSKAAVSIKSAGETALNAQGKTTIESPQGVVIQSGGSKIEITPAGITINGTLVDIDSRKLTAKAATMTLDASFKASVSGLLVDVNGKIQTQVKAGVNLVNQGGIVRIN